MFDTQEMRAPALPETTALPMPPLPTGQPIHLLDRLTAVFKHRRVAGTAFVLVVSVMMLQSYSTIPMYETAARIEIQNPRAVQMNIGQGQDPYYEDPDVYNSTQISILQSRELARRVVERLDLKNHPDFNGTKPRPRDPVSLIREARSAASRWVRSLVARPVPGDPPATTAQAAGPPSEAALIGAFLAGLTPSQQRGTNMFEVRYRHTNPDFAVLAANAVAEVYVEQNVDVRLGDTSKRLQYVTQELAKAEERMRKAEQEMVNYRRDNDALSLEASTDLVGQTLTAAQSNLARAEADRRTKEIIYNQLKDIDPADPASDNHPNIGNNREVITAKNELGQLEQRKADLEGKNIGANNPQMKAVLADLQTKQQILIAERRKVIASARTEFEQAREQERSFAGALERARRDSQELSNKGGAYKVIADKAENERLTVKRLLEEKTTLEVAASNRGNNARLRDPAEPNRTPVTPNSKKDLMTAILAGLTIALALAFGIEYLDDSIKTPEDITKRLNLPLLGLVPAVKGDHVPVLTETVPHDFGEAFRSLRTSLVFTSGGESTRVIAVTSSQPLEGKTTTAANLAFALALGGARVLLIDADMRRPGLHKTLGIQNSMGLSHILTGQIRIKEAVQRSAEPNLFVITAGRTPPNPSELLASDKMNQLLAALAQGPFEWVVIDTPPVLAVTDAVIIAQKVAGVVFVVGSEMTRRVHADRAIETLQSGKVRSIGVVLNRVDFNRNKYYYSRYYGYQYKSYYGQNAVS